MIDRPKAFDDAVISHRDLLTRRAMSLCRNHAGAEDLVQETMIIAMRKFYQFQEGSNLKAWLMTIMRNRFISDKRKRMREIEDADGNLASFLASPESQSAVCELNDTRKLMRLMDPDMRKALELVTLLDYSYEEAAEAMRTELGTIKSRVSRARSFLENGGHLEEEVIVAPAPVVFAFSPDIVEQLYREGKSVSEIAESIPGSKRAEIMEVILIRRLKPKKP